MKREDSGKTREREKKERETHSCTCETQTKRVRDVGVFTRLIVFSPWTNMDYGTILNRLIETETHPREG